MFRSGGVSASRTSSATWTASRSCCRPADSRAGANMRNDAVMILAKLCENHEDNQARYGGRTAFPC